MPGRPSRRNDETPDSARRAGGVIPAGALAMLFAISGVFLYGIYLKTADPSKSTVDAPARPASPVSSPAPRSTPTPPAGSRPSKSPEAPAPDAGLPTQTAMGYGDEPLATDSPGGPAELPPVIPEATTAGTLGTPSLGAGTASSPPRSLAPSSPPPGPPSSPPADAAPAPAASVRPPVAAALAPASAPRTSQAASAARTATPAPRTSAPAGPTPAPRPSSPAVKARHDEPRPTPATDTGTSALDSQEAPSTAAVGTDERVSRLAAAPRGAAPAVALRKAREQFGAKRYKEAAHSWNDWAQRAPAGSWTVQIAAIRLDKPTSAGKLEGISGRDGAFILPSGALPGGLAPVCVGVYPSEEAARRAAASMAPFPGSSSRPIAKPLSSLSR